MTSKHCFSKILKEDFRHKIWMLVLSCIGNILAILVFYLLWSGRRPYYGDEAEAMRLYTQATTLQNFFGYIVVISGAIIAVAGAFIVGLSGFRYVFHRDMVDNYHSMPVKRRTLFLAGWLNGFLIWFVPYLVCMLTTMMMGIIRLGQLKEAFGAAEGITEELTAAFAGLTGGVICREVLLTLLTMVVVFLLVYHLILLSVMLCGNLLNTLVTAGTLGIGIFSLYGIGILFCEYYLDTFMASVSNTYLYLTYGSPLVSGLRLLMLRGGNDDMGRTFFLCLFVNLAIALAMGVLAAIVYNRRPSELAEQGLRNRPVKYAVQISVSLGLGAVCWFLFHSMAFDFADASEGAAMVWGIFGGLLAVILAFGVLDIIFSMDFKAFFSHRALMAVSAAGVVLFGLTFSLDWMNYDGYLPEKEDIAGIALMGYRGTGDLPFGEPYREILAGMNYTDSEVIYDFLSTAVDAQRTGYSPESEGRGAIRNERLYTKITLENGRSYYREYTVYNYDCEAALEILASSEYQNRFIRIPEQDALSAYCLDVGTQLDSRSLWVNQGDISQEAVLEICEAFNLDAAEQPELMIRQDGRGICRVEMFVYDGNKNLRRRFTVFESMTHTIEAMRKNGLESLVEIPSAEDISEIRLELNVWPSELEPGMDLIEMAREWYGVWPEDEVPQPQSPAGDGVEASATSEKASVAWTEDDRLYLSITDRNEIAELEKLLCYTSSWNGSGAFGRGRTGVSVSFWTEDGSTEIYNAGASIQEGTLPEKYILRFGELMK